MADKREIDFLQNEFFVQWVLNPSAEHTIYWNRWFSQNPDKLNEANKAKAIIQSLKPATIYKIKESHYNEIFEQILKYKRELDDKEYQIRKQKRYRFNLYAAASVSIAFLAAAIVFYLNVSDSGYQETRLIVKETSKGVKQTLTLEDGSMVKLNAGSSLHFPQPFSDSARVLHLTGEAYFDVTSDPARPFIIRTDDFETRVLGTAFNVRAYPGSVQYVAVASGSVKLVAPSGLEKILHPYEMGQWDRATETFTTKPFNFKKVMGWKDGLLLFEKANFGEIKERLSWWFGVEFTMEENFDINGVYSGEFRNESLENILNGISFSSEFHFRIEENKVYIFK